MTNKTSTIDSARSAERASTLESPDSWVRAREAIADERERVADNRDEELAQRGEIARLRDEALRARAELEEVSADRERVLAQIREANERLVIATVRADELAEQAEAAREAAEADEERFRALVTTSAAIVWHADAHGHVRVDLESWRSFTGLASIEEGDSGWLQAIHPDDRERARAQWAQAIATGSPYSCQHRIHAAGGDYVWVASRAVPIVHDGRIREWIGKMTDVTDRVRIEEARELFIAILGHDLVNPLAAVLGGAELLEVAEIPAPYGGVAARITRSAKRMEVIIRDMMDFARGRLGGGIPVVPSACDLGTICAGVVDEMRQAYPSRAIMYEAVGDLHGLWDEDRAEQVLSNLIGNALAHGADPIRVAARGARDEVVTTVHNHGQPIPHARIASLFEPFTQGARESRQGAQGLGLGLYIVNEIVRAHGGAISVTSERDIGTTFEVRWLRTPRQRTMTPPPA